MPAFFAPIVGAHFRPPAKDVLQMLPGGTELEIVRQPDNPHDPNACAVRLHGFSKDGPFQGIFRVLIEQQPDPDVKALFTDPLQLGYIDAKKTGLARQLAEAMDKESMPAVGALLSFDPTGKPCADITWGDEESEASRISR